MFKINELVKILMNRDGLSAKEAQEEIGYARERILSGEDAQDVLQEEFGLEPDYIYDII